MTAVERPVTVVRARSEHAEALAAFFARVDTPCHCRYWQFAGDTNAWLARSAHEPDVNRQEMTTELAAASDDALAFAAFHEGVVVGWTKLVRAPSLPKLYAQRPYRGLSCFGGDRNRTYALSCVLVTPDFRRRGIARALVRSAVEGAREAGAHGVEAFPRRGEPLRDDELGTGPFSVFAAEGFRVVNDFRPYPVLRKSL